MVTLAAVSLSPVLTSDPAVAALVALAGLYLAVTGLRSLVRCWRFRAPATPVVSVTPASSASR